MRNLPDDRLPTPFFLFSALYTTYSPSFRFAAYKLLILANDASSLLTRHDDMRASASNNEFISSKRIGHNQQTVEA